MSADEVNEAWSEYEGWMDEHCEHGVPPDVFCEDCNDRR